MYRDRWTPVEGEVLVCERDASNTVDSYAVAVVSGTNVIGHVPRKISACCALFLRAKGSITCTIQGGKRYSRDLPQGGLEVPCVFKFRGDSSTIAKIRKVLMITGSDTGYNGSQCQKIESKKTEAPATPWIMLYNIPLNQDDKTIVLSGGWLNDKHINFAHQILKKQFPGLTGLASTLILSQGKLLSPISTASRYVQIIHTNVTIG